MPPPGVQYTNGCPTEPGDMVLDRITEGAELKVDTIPRMVEFISRTLDANVWLTSTTPEYDTIKGPFLRTMVYVHFIFKALHKGYLDNAFFSKNKF